MSTPDTKTFDWDVKSLDDAGSFELYAAVFSNVDRQSDVIEPGAFQNLAEFVKDGVGLLNHDQAALPVAIIDSAEQDSRGLRVRGRFHTTAMAQELRTVIKERMGAGKSAKCSIGYRIADSAVEKRDGRAVNSIKKLHIYEFSFVNIPANPEAGVISVKSGGPGATTMAAEPDARSVVQAIKELLGISKKARGPSSAELRLKSFAQAMHEHGEQSREHCKAMKEHADRACELAKEMKSFLKQRSEDEDKDDDEDEDEKADDPAAHGGRPDYGRDEEGDEEEERPREGKRKVAKPEDTDDAAPPKSEKSHKPHARSPEQAYRDELRLRLISGKRLDPCP